MAAPQPDLVHVVDHQSLWKEGRFFAQIQNPSVLPSLEECKGKSVQEITRLVASKLLGSSYELQDKPVQSSDAGMEVYDTLTQILPFLSDQSEFYWTRAARPLASLLSSAKYPIRSQASHLVFWWARLGGLNGVTQIGLSKLTRTFWVRDGSNTELSWVIPHDTDPEEEANRHIRFAIDPFHPVTGRRLAGGAVIDWLCGEGGMGLVDSAQSGKEWKEIIEKWLYPDLKSTEDIVPGGTYAIAFDLEPDGVIGLKQYYVPPRVGTPEADACPTTVTLYRHPESIEPLRTLFPQLHPSLMQPFNVLCDYLAGDGKQSGLKFIAIACDITTLEKNRLKMYFWPTAEHCLKDVIRDMTLGGRSTGPRVDEAIANLRKLHTSLFPGASDDTPMLGLDGGPGGLSYYYELFVGHDMPCPKAYFDMTAFGANDLDTTKRVENFFASVGKKAKEGWYSSSLERAFTHRPLSSRTGIQTGVTFAMKPKGWQTTGYMCTEIFAVERYPDDPQTHDEMIQEHYDIYMGRRRKRSLLAMEQAAKHKKLEDTV